MKIQIRKAVLAGFLASASWAAYAQAPGGSAAPEADSTPLTNDIVVTAQRREERLQDVPISVIAVQGEALQRQGATATADLTSLVPGLQMGKSSTTATPYLRGIGTQNLTPGSDPSVPIYIDGVYLSAPSAFFFSFNNIERLEVLKGPQGTLFGRNSTGGLIQVVTKDPQPGLSGKASLGYGSFNTVNASAYVSGGSDVISADLSVFYNNQSDGWGRNAYDPVKYAGPPFVGLTGKPSNEAGVLKEYGIRSKLKLTGERTTARLSFTYALSEGNQGHYRHLLPGNSIQRPGYTTPYFYGTAANEGFYDFNSDTAWNFKSYLYLAGVDIEHDAGAVSLKSITSYLKARGTYDVSSDASPQTGLYIPTENPTETYTQEFQIFSNKGYGPEWLSWIGGLYYLKSEAGYDPQPRYFSTLTGLVPFQNINAENKTESMSAFAQATFDLPAEFALTLGGRYNRDKLRGAQSTENFPSGAITQFVRGVKATQDAVTWRVALDKHFTKDIMVYGSVNRGYKSGVFNSGTLCSQTTPSCPTVAPPVRPEKLLAYEVGLRSDLFDRLLRLNVSGFYYKYKDIQIQAVVGSPPTSLLTNAAKATVKGVDIETQLRPTRNLTFAASASILDAKYDAYPGAIRYTRVTNGAASSIFDAAGRRLNRAPKFSGNMSVNWVVPVEFGEFVLNASIYHSNSFYYEPGNDLREKAYDLANAQLAFRPNDKLQFRVWGKNLTDKKYYFNQVVSTSGQQGAPAAPRTYGIALDYQF